MTDVFTRAAKGFYQTKLPLVDREFGEKYKVLIQNLGNIPLTLKQREEETVRLQEELEKHKKKTSKAHYADQNRLHQIFEKDVEEYFGFSYIPSPLKVKIHDLAWELGHSCGYSEVLTYYDNLVELAESAYELGKYNS